MQEKLTEKSCVDFVAVLATKAPVPGGGGAAALVGAIGTALGNMVGSLTVGKKKYADVEAEVLTLKSRSDALQGKLLTMVEKDAEAFEPLAKAYGLPKDTEEQRAEKARIMEQVLRQAAQTPLEIMELCTESLSVIERFSQIGSRLALSDAGCAAACCRAALDAASLNVFINTKAMTDRPFADELNRKTEALLEAGDAKADAIFAAVRNHLRGEA
jgi:formiminotetrahydrofolate cyclodeaminase